ncbi:BQ5605_C008g05113 [Microbotryum silenes-dioicae]|uniref:BQ5605_C008g05113 protein n=1 Tax=Microbotryum silenes-dioicae TaxID=796604 RepID=A0A2X0MCF3_9BASI|nr:BQ5605_C008g05113 [Microbotryum silenes-dioicae]
MNSTAGAVLEFTVLKSQPKADEALTLLRKIHSLVKPIMKKHRWTLPKLVEFFPKQSNLLGVNYNGGEKICLRLRPANRPTSFYPLEDLIGTMLHELTHNVHGPHDTKFFTFLDGLNKEFDALVSTGWSGEGFHGRGERVGVGRSHDVSMGEARELALKKAEERMRLGKLMGKGGRLGGDIGFTKGKTRGEILAEAAERRAQANKACGADHSGDHHLPPAIQAEIDQAEADGTVHVVDLTLDSDGEDEDVPRAIGDLVPPKVKQESDPNLSSDGIEILSVGVPSKRQPPPPSNAASAKKTRSSSSTPSTTSQQPHGSRNRPASGARTSSSVSLASSSTSDSWTCPTCTYDNILPFLTCEMCVTERPHTSKPTMLFRPHWVAREAGAPDPSILDLDEGWICSTCTTMNQHAFWTCSSCGTVKKSSTRS